MNHGTVTGGVVKEAASAYTPSTAACASRRRVQFSIAVADSHGARAFWNCEAEGDDALLDWLVGQATPGRGIKLDYELATRPFFKNKIHCGEVRFLRVIKAEFPLRRTGEPCPVDDEPSRDLSGDSGCAVTTGKEVGA